MLKRQLLFPALILLLAAIVRVAFLDIKPPHFDEGINGWFCDQMAKTGFYAYDPTNYHGPLHFYVLFVSLHLFGRSLWALRLPVVLAIAIAYWTLWDAIARSSPECARSIFAQAKTTNAQTMIDRIHSVMADTRAFSVTGL